MKENVDILVLDPGLRRALIGCQPRVITEEQRFYYFMDTNRARRVQPVSLLSREYAMSRWLTTKNTGMVGLLHCYAHSSLDDVPILYNLSRRLLRRSRFTSHNNVTVVNSLLLLLK